MHPAISLARTVGFLSLIPALCSVGYCVTIFYAFGDVVSLLRSCSESHLLGTKSETKKMELLCSTKDLYRKPQFSSGNILYKNK